MVELALQALLQQGALERIEGDGRVCVRGVKHDSRRVEPGDLFAAVPGVSRHGVEFAADAVARGAVAVLADRELDPAALGVPVAYAADVHVALAAVARVLYDDPTASLPVVGITGTNGKTTVSFLLEAVLQHAGLAPAVIGTVNFRGPGGELPATHTTPMPDDLMRLCRWALDTHASHLLLEVSSHALSMHRADGVHFEVAAFTNLSQDHLDYHQTLEAYGAAKQRLFVDLAPRQAVINVDDTHGAALARVTAARLIRCTRRAEREAEIRVLSFAMDARGIRARVATPQGEGELDSPLLGEHNLENLLVTLGCAVALGVPLTRALAGLSSARGAPGRLERIGEGEPLVVVDYAHSPDALGRVLDALRPLTRKRLIAVFGCGGDRDRGKRPLMGRVAVERADLTLVTDDNPRSEPSEQIVAQIVEGIAERGLPEVAHDQLPTAQRGYSVCGDRGRAIELAVMAAQPGDCVLIAGKGHETVQIVGERREPFDDREKARAALARRR